MFFGLLDIKTKFNEEERFSPEIFLDTIDIKTRFIKNGLIIYVRYKCKNKISITKLFSKKKLDR